MIELRRFQSADIDDLYAISLATGDAGKDASHLHSDGRLVGHIYSAPYAKFNPEAVFVAEDEEGVGGYIVGTLDTRAFEARLARDWWPGLAAVYPDPAGDASGWNADQRRSFAIHHPRLAPDSLVEAYPAHIHMNLLPRMQGQGAGTALLEHWVSNALASGLKGIHLGVNPGNERGLGFWLSKGFVRLSPPVVPLNETTIWLGRTL